MITGASGVGKSSLALDLMALGADLVGDDRIELSNHEGVLQMSPVKPLEGLIEARGIGILQARCVYPARVRVVVDLDRVENERIPLPKYKTLLDVSVRCLHKVESSTFPAAILQYLKAGFAEV